MSIELKIADRHNIETELAHYIMLQRFDGNIISEETINEYYDDFTSIATIPFPIIELIDDIDLEGWYDAEMDTHNDTLVEYIENDILHKGFNDITDDTRLLYIPNYGKCIKDILEPIKNMGYSIDEMDYEFAEKTGIVIDLKTKLIYDITIFNDLYKTGVNSWSEAYRLISVVDVIEAVEHLGD